MSNSQKYDIDLVNFNYFYRVSPSHPIYKISKGMFLTCCSILKEYPELHPANHNIIEFSYASRGAGIQKVYFPMIKLWMWDKQSECDMVMAFGIDADYRVPFKFL